MNVRFGSLLFCGALGLFLFCQKADDTNKKLVQIGMTSLTQADVNAFSRVSSSFPTSPAEFALNSRSPITGFIETEVIYKKQRFNPALLSYRRSADWKWKQRYMISFSYMNDILQRQLGYTDNELRKYYDANKNEFKNSVVSDSGGKACTTWVVSPFDIDVKRQIAEKLFLRDYKPDSAFLANAPVNDPNAVNGRWLKYMRYEGYREVFLKKFFKEKYGKPFPDSLSDLVGNDKPLSQADMDVIFSWIPAERREMLKDNKQSQYDFAKWLLRWMLFSEKAKATGFASSAEMKATLKWAWRFEIAQRYITERLVPKAKSMARIDTAMALYSYWDEFGNPGVTPDTAPLKDHYNRLISQQTNEHYDALLYQLRKNARVRFTTKDWSDERGKDPRELLRRADSLRDTGATSEAETVYRTLTNDFVFTPEGKKALVELAKLQTEQQIYTEAIRNYRRVLLTDSDPNKRCNYMFMIGFIYDEYLDRPEMAEVNYKWVLKNTPDCELNDDAEFMMLHLGEQMSSVEELQAEVKRQGKKIEDSEADSSTLSVETEQKQK